MPVLASPTHSTNFKVLKGMIQAILRRFTEIVQVKIILFKPLSNLVKCNIIKYLLLQVHGFLDYKTGISLSLLPSLTFSTIINIRLGFRKFLKIIDSWNKLDVTL